jgi:hypothetical protein
MVSRKPARYVAADFGNETGTEGEQYMKKELINKERIKEL